MLVRAVLLVGTALASVASTAQAPSTPVAGDAPTADGPDPGMEVAPATFAPTRHSRTIGGVNVDAVVMSAAVGEAAGADDAAVAFDELARVAAIFDSDGAHIGAINRAAGEAPVSVDPEVFAVLMEVQRIAKLSRGAFDPTSAAYDALWSAEATADGAERIPPAAAVLKATKAVVGLNALVLDPVKRTARLKDKGARLSVADVAWGYGLDRARGALIERGVPGFVLSVAGDVVVHGTKNGAPWIVGLQDPRAAGPFMTIEAPDTLGGAVMTAIDTDGAFFVGDERYHRLLDPRSGQPGRKARSATVLGSDALTAKCLARAIFILGAKDGLALAGRLKGAEAVVVGADNRVGLSPTLKKLAAQRKIQQRPPTDAP